MELTTRQKNKLDKQIEAAYRAECCNIQIDMMKIPSIFNVGRAALIAGADETELKRVIREYVETIREN